MWREHAVLATFAKRLKLSIVAYEYPGYSGAEGAASEETSINSLDRVYRVLTREFGVSGRDILLMGRSIGTGVSCQFAARHQLGGLVLVSPFSSIRAVVEHGGGMLGGSGASSLISQRFDSLSAMPLIQCPLLIFHGEKDEMCPVEGAQELLDASISPEKHLERFAEMTHDNVFLQDDSLGYITAMVKSFKAHIPLPSEGPAVEIDIGPGFECSVDLSMTDKHWAISQKEEEDAIHMIQMAFDSINAVVNELAGLPEDQACMVYSMLRMIFHATDNDHNEKMDKEELLTVMKCFAASRNGGCPVPSSHDLKRGVEEAFEMYDITGNGVLEFHEFVEFFCHTCSTEEGNSAVEGVPVELMQQVRLLSAQEFMEKQEQEQSQYQLVEDAMHADLELSMNLSNDLDRIQKEMEQIGSPKSPSAAREQQQQDEEQRRSSGGGVFSLMDTNSWW